MVIGGGDTNSDNKTDVIDVKVIGRSSIQVQRMFSNWLNWEISSQEND